MDNGVFDTVETLYIYYDEKYGSVSHKVWVESGAPAMTQQYYLNQLENNLDYLGFTNHSRVDAESAAALTDSTSDAKGKGLVIISGALPSTIYNGETSSKILEWIAAGGTLYWSNDTIGRYISNQDGSIIDLGIEKQTLFFGVICCNSVENADYDVYSPDYAPNAIDNEYREVLSLKNNKLFFALNPSKLVSEHLSLGYTDETYSSITFVKHGTGQICNLGGTYSNHQRMDMSQIIAAGICWESKILDKAEGTATHGTANNQLNIPGTHGNLSIYIYLGGYYSVYGERFLFPAA